MENQEPLLENNWRRQLSTADRNILVQKMYEDKHIIQVFNGSINRVMVLRECVIDPTMVDDARLIALSTNFEECVYQNAVSKVGYSFF